MNGRRSPGFRSGFEGSARVLGRGGVLWILALVALGCGKKTETQQETSTTAETPASQGAPAVIDAATAGTITGKVVLNGTAPAMQPIDAAAEPVCHTKSESDPLHTENVLANANGTLRNVFVYVKSGLGTGTFPAPTTAVTLDQVGCKYIPHVFGIQVGQPLTIKNSDDGVLHNIHALSAERNGFNFGMPKVMETKMEFKRPEVMVKIKCDVHGWMHAYAGVLDHPYYAVTGEDGSFSLKPLPPGEYVIESWHEEYGAQVQTVAVGPSETKDITFTFTPAS